jgi:hypothetical protein
MSRETLKCRPKLQTAGQMSLNLERHLKFSVGHPLGLSYRTAG